MNRRHLLQTLGLSSLSALWSQVAGGVTGIPAPPGVAVTSEAAAEPALDASDPDRVKVFSLCLGLGREAEALLAARPSWTSDSAVEGLSSQCGTDPAILAAWSAVTPPHPVDISVLVIDARDPRAREASRFWARRLAEVGYMRTALVIGEDHLSSDLSWRRELRTHFDVVDLCPQRSILRALATRSLVEGLLLLHPSFLGHDVADFRAVLRTGTQARSAATVWSRAARRHAAWHRLWHALPSTRIQGALGFLHGGMDLSLQDFDTVNDALRERLPEETASMVVPLLHVHWPERRQVLGLTLVGDGFDAPLATAPGRAAGFRQELSDMTDHKDVSHATSDTKHPDFHDPTGSWDRRFQGRSGVGDRVGHRFLYDQAKCR
ncbi:hypothetical protein CCR95_22505 [Thiocystis minor]|uniref:hypothetical protein n=1 Tax=Thiocystis minor TaxID=61597 RepID=UPI001914247F|nr:hypothetical protein [Thiocystis minor]MBK5966771.1 hypothetical protein [Thiocystis minor]